jgi:hypothetical protein
MSTPQRSDEVRVAPAVGQPTQLVDLKV